MNSFTMLAANLLAGLAALGGVLLANILKRGDDRSQRSWDARLRRADLLREKGEMLYIALDNFQHELRVWSQNNVSYLRGQMKEAEYKKKNGAIDFSVKDALQVINLNVHAYFPHLIAELDTWLEALSGSATEGMRLTKLQDGGISVADSEIVAYGEKGEEMVKSLRQLANNVAASVRDVH